jgi:hypothetical protein
MKSAMGRRERVERVLDRDVPDFVPIGGGLFQNWEFIDHFNKTRERGKWTLEEICRAVGRSGVDYAFDLATSLRSTVSCSRQRLKLLIDIVGAGADGINPLEPDIVDIERLREEFPDLIFWGGIDNNGLLGRASVEEVEQAVRNLIETAGRNGRLPLGSSGQFHPANELENVLAMFEFGRKYGKY